MNNKDFINALADRWNPTDPGAAERADHELRQRFAPVRVELDRIVAVYNGGDTTIFAQVVDWFASLGSLLQLLAWDYVAQHFIDSESYGAIGDVHRSWAPLMVALLSHSREHKLLVANAALLDAVHNKCLHTLNELGHCTRCGARPNDRRLLPGNDCDCEACPKCRPFP